MSLHCCLPNQFETNRRVVEFLNEAAAITEVDEEEEEVVRPPLGEEPIPQVWTPLISTDLGPLKLGPH